MTNSVTTCPSRYLQQGPLWRFRALEVVMCDVDQPAGIPDVLQQLSFLRLWRVLSRPVSPERKRLFLVRHHLNVGNRLDRGSSTYLPRQERFQFDDKLVGQLPDLKRHSTSPRSAQ